MAEGDIQALSPLERSNPYENTTPSGGGYLTYNSDSSTIFDEKNKSRYVDIGGIPGILCGQKPCV